MIATKEALERAIFILNEEKKKIETQLKEGYDFALNMKKKQIERTISTLLQSIKEIIILDKMK